MAGYFSNHSQSRFLSNTNTANTATTTTAQPPSSQAQNPPPMLTRPRAPSSRHFATSLSASSGDEKSQVKEKGAGTGVANGAAAVHPLRNTYVRTITRPERVLTLTVAFASPRCRWVFWFRQQRAPGNKITNYEEGIKKISAFGSVRYVLSSLRDYELTLVFRWSHSGPYGHTSTHPRVFCPRQTIFFSTLESEGLFGKIP